MEECTPTTSAALTPEALRLSGHSPFPQRPGVACEGRSWRQPSCSPANDHRQDDGEPPELQDLHDGRVLLSNEDPHGDQGREANTHERCQVSIVCGERGGVRQGT